MGRALAGAGVSPNVITTIGAAGVVAGALVFYPQGWFFGGTLVIWAFVMLDMVDGAVARAGGTASPFGGVLDSLGIQLVFQTAGVVVALVFVASPFYLRQAQSAFETLDPSLLEASRTLGASEARTFARVACPVAFPSLLAGAALAWGRALGEFGATLVFAGSFQKVTQTAPLAIYAQFGTDFPGALALAAVLVAVSVAILGGVKVLTRYGDRTRLQRAGAL